MDSTDLTQQGRTNHLFRATSHLYTLPLKADVCNFSLPREQGRLEARLLTLSITPIPSSFLLCMTVQSWRAPIPALPETIRAIRVIRAKKYSSTYTLPLKADVCNFPPPSLERDDATKRGFSPSPSCGPIEFLTHLRFGQKCVIRWPIDHGPCRPHPGRENQAFLSGHP